MKFEITIEDMEEIIQCILDCDMDYKEAIDYAKATMIEIAEDKE